jgi:small-conductance mechanosensitive channel
MDTLIQIQDWLHQTLGVDHDLQRKLVISLVIAFSLWVLQVFFQRGYVFRIEDTKQRYQSKKVIGYLFSFLAFLLIGIVWIEDLRSIVTYLGLLSAGLAVALRDPIVDLMAWGFILWRKPFEVGDRIQIGDYAGDVIDIRIFQFSLMEIGNWVHADQSTGRVLHIPNGMVFSKVLANYTKASEFIWNEVPVLVTFESNWEKAKQLTGDIANKHAETFVPNAEESFRRASNQYYLHYGKLTPIVYTTVEESGVLLTIRYLCRPRNRRGSEQTLWEDILRSFQQHPDIDFAYPTHRYYNHLSEGVGTETLGKMDSEGEI